jgi:type I restriction enzyme M protein
MSKRHRPGISAASVLRHVEEIVVASSGADVFEVVFAVAAGRIATEPERSLSASIARAARKHPTLEIDSLAGVPNDLLARVDELLAPALADLGQHEIILDAVFESLVPRLAKSDKGQFFTPRHVVDFIVQMLAPRKREVVVDPACGSGAFLSRARAFGAIAFGCDVDPRAVRVARLFALVGRADPSAVRRVDGLRTNDLPAADIVAMNPPFAGRAAADGFEVADIVRNPERDVLFLERALGLLRPGGRLGIVLPYNKASGESFAELRRWLAEKARVLAIVGLPRETFLPHTSQRTFVLFAQKRRPRSKAASDERTMFVISERAGKDSGGEPILRDGRLDHDMDDVMGSLGPFLRAEGFS